MASQDAPLPGRLVLFDCPAWALGPWPAGEPDAGRERLAAVPDGDHLTVADEFGISAGSIDFVDDRAGNVAGAEAVGTTGHVFAGAARLRSFLLELAGTSEGDV